MGDQVDHIVLIRGFIVPKKTKSFNESFTETTALSDGVLERIRRTVLALPEIAQGKIVSLNYWTADMKGALLAGLRAGLQRAGLLMDLWGIKNFHLQEWKSSAKIKSKYMKLVLAPV
jgi:hypothetical protein